MSERPRLNLKPRDPNAAKQYEEHVKAAKSNPFGAAKPREQVIAERLGKTEEEVLREAVRNERPKLRLSPEQLEQRRQAESRVEEARELVAGASGTERAELQGELASREAELEALLDTFEAMALEAARNGEVQRPSERRQQAALLGEGGGGGEGYRGGGGGGGRGAYGGGERGERPPREGGGFDRYTERPPRREYERDGGERGGGYGAEREVREYDRPRGGGGGGGGGHYDRDGGRGGYGGRGRGGEPGGYGDRDGGRGGERGGRAGGGGDGDWGQRGGGGGGGSGSGGGGSYERNGGRAPGGGSRGGRGGFDFEDLTAPDYVPYAVQQDRF